MSENKPYNALELQIQSDSAYSPVNVNMGAVNITNEDKAVADAAFMESFNSERELEDTLNEKSNEVINFNSKEEFFTNSVNKHIENKNNGLKQAINNHVYETEDDVTVASKFYEDNLEMPEDVYSLEKINNSKLDTYKVGGSVYTSEDKKIEELFSDSRGAQDAEFMAHETLNDLIEEEGFLNTVSSFGSEMFVVRPLSEMLVGDISRENVLKDINSFQLLDTAKEKKERAVELAHKWWDGTNKNTFTTQFLVSQLNSPYAEQNLDDNVHGKVSEIVFLGVGADIASIAKTAFKGTAKGSAKLSKGALLGAEASAKIIRKSFKRNPISGMEQSGNTSGAAKIIADITFKAKQDPNLMNVLTKYSGFDEDTIYSLSNVSNAAELEALALSNPKILEEYATVQELQAHFRTLKQTTDEIDLKDLTNAEVSRTGLTKGDVAEYTVSEQERLQGKAVAAVDNYNQALDIETNLLHQGNDDVISAVFVESKNRTAVEQFKLEEPNYAHTETITLDINAVQPFATIKSSSLSIQGKSLPGGEYIFSPEGRLGFGVNYGGDLGTKSFVSEVTAVRNEAQAYLAAAKPVISKVMNGVNKLKKKDRNQLADILRQGDEYTVDGINVGQAYSYRELKNMGASDSVVKSYTEYRTLADQMHNVNNSTVRESMKFKGYQNFSLSLPEEIASGLRSSKSVLYKVNGNDASFFGVKFRSSERKTEIAGKLGTENVFVESTGKIMTMRTVDSDTLLMNDLVRLNNNVGMNGKPVRFVLTKTKGTQLPETVLEYREGFIPRKYEARHYIFRENEYGDAEVISGVVRASDVKSEIAKLEKANPELTGKLHIREEGQDSITSTGDNFLGDYDIALASNMSFNNHIRKKQLLETADGKRVQMKNPYDALSDQVQASVASKPVAVFRASAIKRLDKTLQQLQNTEKLSILKNPSNVLEGIKPEFLNKYGKYQELINYVNKQVVDPSDAAFNAYSRNVRKLVNFIDDKAGQVLPEKINNSITKLFDNGIIGLHDLEKIDPIRAVKTLNFVRLLGLFDPRQLMLQALQTTSIISISPRHGAASTVDYMLWKLSMKNFRRNPEALKDIISKNGMDLSDFEGMILDLKQSNVLQSITNNADLTLQSHGVFSTAKKVLDNVVEKGMFFYDLGNEMVYSSAFFTARREILKGAKRRLTKDEMITAQDRVNKLAYNFTSANKAGFQDGVSSLATQFMQVPAKAYESLVSSQLTTPEKLRLLAGQGAFFGYAGVPMGSAFVGYIASTLGWTEKQVLAEHEQAIVDFENGFAGMIFSTVFGYEVSTENLQFFGAGVSDVPFYPIVKELFDNNQLMNGSTILKEALGPSMSSLAKGSTILGQAYDVFDTLAMGEVDQSYALSKANFFDIQSEFSKYFGVTNKLAKAQMIYELGVEKDKYGQVIVRWKEDEKAGRAIGAMLGLNSIDKEVAYSNKLERMRLEDNIKGVDLLAEDVYNISVETKDIKYAKNILLSYCKEKNVDSNTCRIAWEKVINKRIDTARSQSMVSKEKELMIETLGLYDNQKDAMSNEYKLNLLKEKTKRSSAID